MPVEHKVFEIISETLSLPKDNISAQHKLIDLVDDSLDLFELLIRFEKELGRQIKYEEIAAIETVGDIVQYAYAQNIMTV